MSERKKRKAPDTASPLEQRLVHAAANTLAALDTAVAMVLDESKEHGETRLVKRPNVQKLTLILYALTPQQASWIMQFLDLTSLSLFIETVVGAYGNTMLKTDADKYLDELYREMTVQKWTQQDLPVLSKPWFGQYLNRVAVENQFLRILKMEGIVDEDFPRKLWDRYVDVKDSKLQVLTIYMRPNAVDIEELDHIMASLPRFAFLQALVIEARSLSTLYFDDEVSLVNPNLRTLVLRTEPDGTDGHHDLQLLWMAKSFPRLEILETACHQFDFGINSLAAHLKHLRIVHLHVTRTSNLFEEKREDSAIGTRVTQPLFQSCPNLECLMVTGNIKRERVSWSRLPETRWIDVTTIHAQEPAAYWSFMCDYNNVVGVPRNVLPSDAQQVEALQHSIHATSTTTTTWDNVKLCVQQLGYSLQLLATSLERSVRILSSLWVVPNAYRMESWNDMLLDLPWITGDQISVLYHRLGHLQGLEIGHTRPHLLITQRKRPSLSLEVDRKEISSRSYDLVASHITVTTLKEWLLHWPNMKSIHIEQRTTDDISDLLSAIADHQPGVDSIIIGDDQYRWSAFPPVRAGELENLLRRQPTLTRLHLPQNLIRLSPATMQLLLDHNQRRESAPLTSIQMVCEEAPPKSWMMRFQNLRQWRWCMDVRQLTFELEQVKEDDMIQFANQHPFLENLQWCFKDHPILTRLPPLVHSRLSWIHLSLSTFAILWDQVTSLSDNCPLLQSLDIDRFMEPNTIQSIDHPFLTKAEMNQAQEWINDKQLQIRIRIHFIDQWRSLESAHIDWKHFRVRWPAGLLPILDIRLPDLYPTTEVQVDVEIMKKRDLNRNHMKHDWQIWLEHLAGTLPIEWVNVLKIDTLEGKTRFWYDARVSMLGDRQQKTYELLYGDSFFTVEYNQLLRSANYRPVLTAEYMPGPFFSSCWEWESKDIWFQDMEEMSPTVAEILFIHTRLLNLGTPVRLVAHRIVSEHNNGLSLISRYFYAVQRFVHNLDVLAASVLQGALQLTPAADVAVVEEGKEAKTLGILSLTSPSQQRHLTRTIANAMVVVDMDKDDKPANSRQKLDLVHRVLNQTSSSKLDSYVRHRSNTIQKLVETERCKVDAEIRDRIVFAADSTHQQQQHRVFTFSAQGPVLPFARVETVERVRAGQTTTWTWSPHHHHHHHHHRRRHGHDIIQITYQTDPSSSPSSSSHHVFYWLDRSVSWSRHHHTVMRHHLRSVFARLLGDEHDHRDHAKVIFVTWSRPSHPSPPPSWS